MAKYIVDKANRIFSAECKPLDGKDRFVEMFFDEVAQRVEFLPKGERLSLVFY